MKLHSPKFEHSLRRGVKRAIKSSPPLKKEFRASRKFRKPTQAMVVIRPLISVGLAFTTWFVGNKTGHLASGLAVITLWGLLFVFIHAQRLLTTLYASTDLRALSVLPLPDTTVFQWQLQKVVFGSLWSLFDFILAFAAVAWSAQLSPLNWFPLVAIAFAAWAQSLALAALGVTWFPRVPYQLVSMVLILMVFGLFMARELVGQAALMLLDSCAPSLNAVLPTGWPVSVARAVISRDALAFLAFLVPTAAIISSIRSSILRLAANYRFQELVRPEPRDVIPDGWEAGSSSVTARPARLGPTAIEEIIENRKFLEEPDWRKRGFLEKTFWDWCNPRQRALAEFVFPNGLAFSRSWLNIFRNLALTFLLALGVGLISPIAENWILAAGLFVTVSHVLACVLSNGRVFQAIHSSGVNIPLYANYPIGFRELGDFLFKHSLVQLPLAVLFSIAACLMFFYHFSQPLPLAAVIGFKLAGLLLASRFIFLTFAFSSGTNDTAKIRLVSMFLVFLVVLFAVSFVALAAASLFWPGQTIAWLCWFLAALEAYGLFRCYGWFYHRNHFDLMNLPRR